MGLRDWSAKHCADIICPTKRTTDLAENVSSVISNKGIELKTR